MKKFLRILIPLVILASIIWFFRDPLWVEARPYWESIQEKIQSLVHGNKPCAEPMAYDLGSFDSRFKISKEYFLSALKDAEAVWEKPSGVNLFSYSPGDKSTGVLKVSLIYDYRQEATQKLAGLGIVVENNRASYDSLKVRYTTLKAKYEESQATFSGHVDAYNKKQAAYEAEVESWNKKGGAPPDEYARLTAEAAELQRERASLATEQKAVTALADQINSIVVVLNRLVATLNLSVGAYNAVNGTLGESFEEGVYQSNGTDRKIDIYEFSTREKLVRVLAHELGHALGIAHVSDPKAIMYKFNSASGTILTNADLSALKSVCSAK